MRNNEEENNNNNSSNKCSSRPYQLCARLFFTGNTWAQQSHGTGKLNNMSCKYKYEAIIGDNLITAAAASTNYSEVGIRWNTEQTK